MWYILLVVCLEYIFSASCLREWGCIYGTSGNDDFVKSIVCMYRKRWSRGREVDLRVWRMVWKGRDGWMDVGRLEERKREGLRG